MYQNETSRRDANFNKLRAATISIHPGDHTSRINGARHSEWAYAHCTSVMRKSFRRNALTQLNKRTFAV